MLLDTFILFLQVHFHCLILSYYDIGFGILCHLFLENKYTHGLRMQKQKK